MTLTRTKFAKLVRLIVLIAIVVVIAGYVAFRSLPYLKGPTISIFQPINGSSISSTTLTIIGRASRINSLSMNDNPVLVDETGNFKETVVVFPGLNVISFYATDQFQRSIKQELKIYGTRDF